MPELSRKLHPLGLWRSSIAASVLFIGTGVIFLSLATLIRDFFCGLVGVGMIINGLAEYLARRNRWVSLALVGAGSILAIVGAYLSVMNYQLSDFLLKP